MVSPRPLFDFLNGRFLITFSAFFLIRLASLAWKTPQNFPRAPRALFSTQIWSKTPFWGFWSDDTRIKKLFLLFFPPLLLCPARAARRNFRFFPGIFLLKRSQNEVRSTWNFRNLSTVTFLRGLCGIYPEKKHWSQTVFFFSPTCTFWRPLLTG